MKHNEGQALILVLLALAVTLTVVLFVVTRSITDVGVASSQESSVRAFSAAEAGVEQALVTSLGSSGDIGSSKYVTSALDFGSTPDEQSGLVYYVPGVFKSGESATVWFASHNAGGGAICDDASGFLCYRHGAGTLTALSDNFLRVCWGDDTTPANSDTTPAIEVSLYFKNTNTLPNTDYSDLRVARMAIDPNSVRQTTVNGFSAPSGTMPCTISGRSYPFSRYFSVNSLDLTLDQVNNAGYLWFARIKFLYNTDRGYPVGVSVNLPSGNSPQVGLPSQGKFISSVGTSGDANRTLSVFQGWPIVPSVFENAIYSGAGITK